jgi:murein DD-endopeptidase MepM/ murein hydrolase activator NlpD
MPKLSPAFRATSIIAALFVAAAPLAAAPATIVTPVTIVAPSLLRQGDPLLVWIVVGATTAEAAASDPLTKPLEAKLVNAAGKTVARARCFEADALIGSGEPGAILAPASEPPASERPNRRLFGALMALPAELPPGAYELVAIGAAAAIVIEPRSFPLETIKLDEANAEILTKPSARKVEEARRLYSLLQKVDDAAVFAEPSALLFPVEGGWKSAGFGDVRRYLYPDGTSSRSVHAGIDWAVVADTIVRSCAKGKVVLAADREVTGKTIVIEHLPGLYSLYFHLSAIEVAEGAVVERGARIALSGSTGMSTGPHLHWELRAKGEAVDPEYWLGPSLLDIGTITAIMNGLIEGR